ncbi:MAG: N-6 DNA methylase [Synergistaceae bacterium]|nr:N-6 DNA methylase [Synergistaceae bacterium]
MPQIAVPEGKILDKVDGALRNDTPEEYVRQTIESRLLDELRYDPARIKIEFGIKIGVQRPRADIVIWEPGIEQTQDNAKIIIECKKSTIPAESAKDGIEQLKSYMAACPNCEWGMWTNSFTQFVFRKTKKDDGEIEFLECNDIPDSNGRIIERPERGKDLNEASKDNLLFVFRTCHNHIYANEGLSKQQAFFEFLKIIFCKIQDERNISSRFVDFYAASMEQRDFDGQKVVAARIGAIFDSVKKTYGSIFDPKDKIKLNPSTLAHIVGALQRYNLLNTHIDIKGKAYEEIVGSNLRGDKGEFFTPRNIAKMTVEMINPGLNDKVLDSSCGTGGFLVIALTHMIGKLQLEVEAINGIPREQWSKEQEMSFRDKVKDLAASQFFGFDLNPDLVKATRMNMVMNNDGSGNILQVNSLFPPKLWPDEFKSHLARAFDIDASELKDYKSIGLFDVIVTNPPFGSKIPIKDDYILEQFELAHIWKRDKVSGEWEMTDKIKSSVPPEILFIERCTQLLREGGRMGIVLPDSILGSPGLGYIRKWILINHKVVASLDLTPDTFQPNNGTQTSILILVKKTEREKIGEAITHHMANYPVFMAKIDKVGHDRRGNKLYKRDETGEEITDGKEKILDDQTLEIPKIFVNWAQKKTAYVWAWIWNR